MMSFKTNIWLVAVVAATICYASSSLSLDKGGRGWEDLGPVDNYTCPGDGAFPDEADCLLFYICWNGSATLNRCTDIMLFDLRYSGCNFAEYVDCQDRFRPPEFPGTVSPPPTTTTVDPSQPTSPTTPGPNGTFSCPNDGVFPHEQKCEYYWSCYAGDATLVHCELDYLYDLRYAGCNFPQYVDCGERERPEGAVSTVTPPESTTAAPATTPPPTGTTEPGNNSTSTEGPSTTGGSGFQCPEPNGSFPDPEDCAGYYVCDSGIPIHANCPEGLHFNPVTETCDWPDAVNCEVSRSRL
ncbi:putative chitinase 3 [Orchesella cincta]|uniref:Putative chitinase 3 n=1 Tax=Orchesella cincta TaxID=48709 RepID=A0A1D2N8D1_ORCCI|nr:putative chitinase 3 [Orchesella cincta]